MGMVVMQPYILVSKLKKIKTKFLRCTGYLTPKNPIKEDLLLKIENEYDQEIPQSQTADNPVLEL